MNTRLVSVPVCPQLSGGMTVITEYPKVALEGTTHVLGFRQGPSMCLLALLLRDFMVFHRTHGVNAGHGAKSHATCREIEALLSRYEPEKQRRGGKKMKIQSKDTNGEPH